MSAYLRSEPTMNIGCMKPLFWWTAVAIIHYIFKGEIDTSSVSPELLKEFAHSRAARVAFLRNITLLSIDIKTNKRKQV